MAEVNENAENCWEYWGCPKDVRESCDAYKLNFGKKCYLISPDLSPCRETIFKNCWECPWCNRIAPDFCERANQEAAQKSNPDTTDNQKAAQKK